MRSYFEDNFTKQCKWLVNRLTSNFWHLTSTSSLEWQETPIFLFLPLFFGSSVAIRFKTLTSWGLHWRSCSPLTLHVSIHRDEHNNSTLETALRTTTKCRRPIKINYLHSQILYTKLIYNLSTILSEQILLKRRIHTIHEYNQDGGCAMK